MSNSKKSSSVSSKLFPILAVVLGIVAIIMGCLPAVNGSISINGASQVSASLTGFQMAFGISGKIVTDNGVNPLIGYATDASYTEGTFAVDGNAGMLITYILAAIGVVMGIVSIFLKGKVKGAISLVAGLFLLAAGIMNFFPIAFAGYTAGEITILVYKLSSSFDLGIGAIIGAIAGILGGLFALAGGVLNLKNAD